MAGLDNRKIEYEKIRMFAMIFMVVFHCRGSVSVYIDTAWEQYLEDILSLLLVTCNSMFFLLSGKFALAAKCETFSDYYRYYTKKIISIGIPVLLYMLFRSLYDYGGMFWQISFWKTYVRNILYGYAGKEYWFLYTLVGLLLVAPFMNKFVANLKKGEMWLFISIGFFYNMVVSYVPYLNLSFAWKYIFGEWTFYFMLGYFLEKVIDTPKKENIIIVIGVLCSVISFIQKQFGMLSHIHDLAPTFTMISCAMFFILKRDCWKKNDFMQRFIRTAGRYSFAVYLVHNPVRYFLAEHIPFLSETAYLPNLLELAICTLTVSFILAFLCENTVIKAIQQGAKRIIESLNKVLSRRLYISSSSSK